MSLAALRREAADLRRLAHARAERRVLPSDRRELVRRMGFAPDVWQDELVTAPDREIIALCARQSGKSASFAALGVCEAVEGPGDVLLLAPALRQAGELAQKARGFLRTLGADAPRVTRETALSLELANGARVIALPGRHDTIRGYSAKLVIVDEAALFADDRLYQGVRPMLSVTGGRIVLGSSAFGSRGFFWQEWTQGGPEWRRISVTAHENPRLTREWLATERRRIGEWWFRQEYENVFHAATDAVFTPDAIRQFAEGDDGLASPYQWRIPG